MMPYLLSISNGPVAHRKREKKMTEVLYLIMVGETCMGVGNSDEIDQLIADGIVPAEASKKLVTPEVMKEYGF
jgi:hypothetical protein